MTELASTINPSASGIDQKLHRAWRKERRFVHTRGLCSLLLWALAMLLVDLVVDWLFLMPGVGRVALLAANFGVLAWVVRRNWLLHIHPFDPVRVALQVEHRHPELQNLLVSFVQLRGRSSDAVASPSLLQAFQKQAVEQSTPLNFKEIINYRELKLLFLVSFFSIAMFGVAAFLESETFNTLLYRLFDPRATKGYPTSVHFTQITGDLKVPSGKEVTLSAICTGRLPSEGTLRIKTPLSKGWESLPLPQAAGGVYGHKFDGVFQSFEYEIRVGDAVSPQHKVTVIAPPQIAKTRIALKYPAYTGLKDAEVGDANLQVPEGTQITWRLSYDMPLSNVFLIREYPETVLATDTGAVAPASAPATQPAVLKLEADHKTAVYSMVATESFPYRIRWIDQEFGNANGDDMRYMLQVDPDVPPEVDIVYPTQDGKATVNKTLTVKFKADDNYGLTGLFVVYSLNDAAAEKRVPLEKLSGKSVEREINWVLKSAIPDLKEGDTLTWSLEVTDNHDKTPLVGRSRSFRLSIVSQAEYLRYVFEEHARVMKEIEAMRQDETQAAQQVETIENPTSQPTSAPVEK